MTEYRWPNRPPSGCPWPQSPEFAGVTFTGRYATYTDADTWYPSWAPDGHLYSPWTDGEIGDASCMSLSRRLLDPGAPDTPATTGQARIEGDDPLSLTIVNLGVQAGDPAPYAGRYPCGSLVHDGVWYYGTYTLDDLNGPCGNWCTLGPFVGFRYSTDLGRTWTETPHTPAAPIFGETALDGARVRIGSPHFVDFGRNMEHSPDGRAYLVAHGVHGPDGWANWVAGDAVYLLRVTPTIDTINDPAAYEFYAGRDPDGRPRWSRDISALQPLLLWPRRLGCVTATYDAPLRRLLLCVSHPSDGHNSLGTFDTMILESEALEGPWHLLHYLPALGPEAYFVNIPSRFIAPNGLTAWLCYSANFAERVEREPRISFPSTPKGSRYGMCLHEFTIETR